MKKLLLLLFLFVGFIKGYSISGGYDYYIFYTPEGKPYLEIYYWVEGNSIEYKQISDTKKQGAVEVTIIVSDKDTSKVFAFEKINLTTREFDMQDTLMSDIYNVKRIKLPMGISFIDLCIKDLNSKDLNSFASSDTIDTKDPSSNGVFVTNVQLIDFVVPTEKENRFSKGGYDILPYHGNYYSADHEKILFYTEIVNAARELGKGGKYLLTCYLENAATGLQLENFIVRKRMLAEDYAVVLSEFPIAALGPGNYNFVVEVRDSLNQYRTKSSIAIAREKLYADINEDTYRTISTLNTWADALPQDSLAEYLHSLRPICEGNEYQYVKNILRENDPATMRKFIYAFWTNRYPDGPGNPYRSLSEFKSYNNLVYYVNEAYSNSVTKGYLTERGRVFLKYGPPNSISDRRMEPSAFPYEIWHYYKLNAQTRVKFVFWCDDASTNDYRLLHSDLRGEIQNRKWEQMLFQRNNNFYGDDNDVNSNFGSWSRDYYNNPR